MKSRVEYDAYRSDLDYYREAPKTEVNQMKLGETEYSFNAKKTEFEKLRSDVQIKLKFLDENRVGAPDHYIVQLGQSQS